MEDRLEAVRVQIDISGLVVSGSMGQLRPNPLLHVEAMLRRELAPGYERLGLARRESRFIAINQDDRLRQRYS